MTGVTVLTIVICIVVITIFVEVVAHFGVCGNSCKLITLLARFQLRNPMAKSKALGHLSDLALFINTFTSLKPHTTI